MYDKIIIGAGLYGMYSALFCARKGQKVLLLECDSTPFRRATYINQARVHMGYHYPRSLTTAMKSAGYFRRFNEDFGFCVHDKFDQVYATSSHFSWTNGKQFVEFCKAANIRCDEVSPNAYFIEGMCDGAFLTEEYTYDAQILRQYYQDELAKYSNADILYGIHLERVEKGNDYYAVSISQKENSNSEKESNSSKIKTFEAPFVLNATYASVNQIMKMVGASELFNLKYELCEIILCKPSDRIRDIGITVMDGPFFSIMPFGKTGLHSLTSVTFTPHVTSYDETPTFDCQRGTSCSSEHLCNCNDCPNKPQSAWPYMSHLAQKYMKPEYGYEYEGSLFSMKPILKTSEVDDSRPTAIKVLSKEPTFVSVLSGKINTVYDLDEYLE